jgi:hypothetical protein
MDLNVPPTAGGVCQAPRGTLLSVALSLWGGLAAPMWGSTIVVLTWLLALRLPPTPENVEVSLATVEAGD